MSLPWPQFEISISRLLLGATTGLTLLWLWKKSRRTYNKYNIPPFPVNPLPIVGNIFTLLGDYRDKMQELRETGGDIYSLDLAGDLHILFHDFNDIKEIWIKHADLITNMKYALTDELVGECNMGIISGRDENWKEQRSTSVSILRSLGMGKNVMAEHIEDEVAVILTKLASFNGQPEDIRVLLNVSVSNIICSVLVGKRFEHEDPYFVLLVKHLIIILQYYVGVALLTPFKQLRHLPGDIFHTKKWTKASLDVNEMFSKVFINKFKQDLQENIEPTSFVEAYMLEMKKLQDKGVATHLSEANLIATIRILFIAGTETTSTSILWCLIYVLHYPEVQEKIYREIETVVGTERAPNINDKQKLIYLNAVILESQRLASIALVGLRREVSSTFEYGGYTIPKGSVLWPVLDSVHFSKAIWGDPENFRPERFIDQNGALINREELIPFSIGKRSCLGISLAKMELFLFLSSVFQRFKLEPEDKSGKLPSLKGIVGSTVQPKPFKLRFVERKNDVNHQHI